MDAFDRPRIRKSLIAEEGNWHNGRRPDPGGGYTIGVGHHLDTEVTQDGYRLAMNQLNYNGGSALLPSDIQSISNPAVNQILNDDIDLGDRQAREFVISPSIWSGLGNVRREVIIQMAFQMGGDGLGKFVKFKQALLDRDYNKAYDEMIDSKWWREDSRDRAQRMANAMKYNSASYFLQGEDPYDGG